MLECRKTMQHAGPGRKTLSAVIGLLVCALLAGIPGFAFAGGSGSPVNDNNRYNDSITFFGEDLGPETPDPNDVWPEDTPLSDEARDAFFESLCKSGTEDLGGFTPGDHYELLFDFDGMGTALLTTSDVYDEPVRVGGGGTLLNMTHLCTPDCGDDMFELHFPTPMKALGFYGFDIGEFGQLILRFYDRQDRLIDEMMVPHTAPGAPSASVFYFGYLRKDHPFSKVVFENTMINWDMFIFDEFTLGRACEVGEGQ